MQFKKRLLLSAVLLFLITLSQRVCAKDYYLDANGGSDNNSGTKSAPWRTLKRLDRINFKPGDHIYFSRGSKFKGGFVVKNSGTKKAPIVFKAYGKGDAPLFINKNYAHLNGNVIQVRGSNIIINGLHFAHTANYSGKAVNTKQKSGPDKKILLVGAIYQIEGANYLIVKNCEFNDCPIGIYINGKHDQISHNKFHDCNRFLWKPDWGPIAIVVGNANNEISYNYCSNYLKEGGNYGADGGFIELDSRYYGGPIHDLKIHHNYSQANEGFMEVTNAGKNIHVYYNVSDDFQEFIFFWSGDSSRVDNNTVIRTRPANSDVNVVFTFRNSGFQIRNNIFVVANGIKVFGTGAYDATNFDQKHEYNLYHSTDEVSTNPIGKNPAEGEIIANPSFVNLQDDNFELTKDSPAIRGGINLGYKEDFSGSPIPSSKPDLGAYQYQE
ncbi:MAG TPA: chondroitinase-B domain-containing protein [Balneolaceae bacterium]|nr:chondroitinase-B domain-containing protein [Balneolaceae bacterium]